MTHDCACGQSQGLCPHQQRDTRLARYPDTMAWSLEILGAGAPASQAGSLGLPDGERLAGQGMGEGQRERHKSILVPAGEARGCYPQIYRFVEARCALLARKTPAGARGPFVRKGRPTCVLGGHFRKTGADLGLGQGAT